jgi:nitrogen-specific signal transduction histidine kinase
MTLHTCTIEFFIRQNEECFLSFGSNLRCYEKALHPLLKTINGNGILQKIPDKIFQPFFTTKPAGRATGLGLSLSYDIIKAHGGEIAIKTMEGEGTVFVIQLSGVI